MKAEILFKLLFCLCFSAAAIPNYPERSSASKSETDAQGGLQYSGILNSFSIRYPIGGDENAGKSNSDCNDYYCPYPGLNEENAGTEQTITQLLESGDTIEEVEVHSGDNAGTESIVQGSSYSKGSGSEKEVASQVYSRRKRELLEGQTPCGKGIRAVGEIHNDEINSMIPYGTIFHKQDNFVNDRVWYKSESGSHGIWFCNKLQDWEIAPIAHLGQCTAQIWTDQPQECPHHVHGQRWDYWSKAMQSWINVSNAFKLECFESCFVSVKVPLIIPARSAFGDFNDDVSDTVEFTSEEILA